MVLAAGMGMTEEYWEALLLATVGELSYEAIGERLGVPVGTVKSRVYRGRGRLRAALSGWAREELGIVS